MKVLILKPKMRCRDALFKAEYDRIVNEIKENKITMLDPDIFDYEVVEIDDIKEETCPMLKNVRCDK